MSTLPMMMMMALLTSQCNRERATTPERGQETPKGSPEREQETPKVRQDTPKGEKVATLSFADSGEIRKEVNWLFDISVHVKDIDLSKIATDDAPLLKHYPGDLKQENLQVAIRGIKKNGDSAALRARHRFPHDYTSAASIVNGVAKFTGLRYVEECSDACGVEASLTYKVCSVLRSDGECTYVEVDPVDKIARAAAIGESSYGLGVKHLGSKRVEITVSKDGQPLANGSAVVDAEARCEMWGWHGRLCGRPSGVTRSLLDDQKIMLSASGTWSTELDSDGSWERKAQAENSEYELDVCKVEFSVLVDNRYFVDLQPGGGDCT